MENRARNESAFNELLVGIRKKSSSYFESAVSDLRKHYDNTNPFYLFSNQFHDFVVKLSTQLENDKKVDVRKCVKELVQELTFYKIACPLKHLRLADSNIPNLFTSLRAKSWPDDVHRATPDERESPPIVAEMKDDIGTKKTRRKDGGTTSSIDLVADRPEAIERSRSGRRKTPPSIDESVEDALKSVPKGVSTIISLQPGQQNSKLERPPPPKSDSYFPGRDGDSTSKRKSGEMVTLKEEEISRKKTSSGQNLIRARKPVLEKMAPLMELSNGVKETIYIIDDDDDDVIVKSSSIPTQKADDCKRTVSVGNPSKEFKATSSPPPSSSGGCGAPKGKVKAPAVVLDDDVFIVEELDAAPPRSVAPPVKRPPFVILPRPNPKSGDGVVVIDAKPGTPVVRRDVSTVGRLKSELGGHDRDVCFVSYSR